jgi:hypothetical protein
MSPAKRSLAVLAVVSLTSFLAASAGATPKDPSKVKCDDNPATQPFMPWQDVDHYVLAPDGDFEKKVDDWVLTGDAELVAGNQPFPVGHKKDGVSLALPGGSEATTGEVCVGVDHPTLRFFLRRVDVDGPADAVITLRAAVRDPVGTVHVVQILTPVVGTPAWAPSAPVVVADPVLADPGLRPFGEVTLPATFTFTASPDSIWQIDNVYVDPWRSR